MQTLTEEEKHVLIEAACEAEESFPLDELETYAEEYRRKLETGEL